MKYDKIIIGAGLYGLYAALSCGRRDEKILVLEYDDAPFKRATYINQARVHMGYHYPRSLSTALKSAGYFERFCNDFSFCINGEFEQIYATSSKYSWSDAEQFKKFCDAADIRCEELNPDRYFKKGMCDGAYLTTEYTYDAMILRDYFWDELKSMKNVELQFSQRIQNIIIENDLYCINLGKNNCAETGFLLNATYASTNQILDMLGFEKLAIKYELCEIILCDVNKCLREYGFTIMDGPFFSIMPFGKTGKHSLTSVTFTPHSTSYEATPVFPCQSLREGGCVPRNLGNCNECPGRPDTAYPYMSNLARKYLKEEYQFSYAGSLFSMKPILVSSEIDDSRPTVIRKFSDKPVCISVLSGKINTVYDLDEVLADG